MVTREFGDGMGTEVETYEGLVGDINGIYIYILYPIYPKDHNTSKISKISTNIP